MKKKILIVIIVLLAVLFFPIPTTYKDGGTKTYTSLTYKYIKWNKMMDIDEPDYTGTSLYLFPRNFMSIDDLFELEYDAVIDDVDDLSSSQDKDADIKDVPNNIQDENEQSDIENQNPVNIPSVIISPIDNELYLEHYGLTIVLPENLAKDAEAELKFVDKMPAYYIFSPSVREANVTTLGPDWDGLANMCYLTAIDEVVTEEEFNQNSKYQLGEKCDFIYASDTYTIVLYHTSDLQCVCEGETLDYYRGLEKLCNEIHIKQYDKADCPTVPPDIPDYMSYLYDFAFSERYDKLVTTAFSLCINDRILSLLEPYTNEKDPYKTVSYGGDGMVPYDTYRYWFKEDAGDLVIATHCYELDNKEYLSYIFTSIPGSILNSGVGIGSKIEDVELIYTEHFRDLGGYDSWSGTPELLRVDDELTFNSYDHLYVWQPFTPETNEIRDITFFTKDGIVVAIEMMLPYEARYVY